MRRRVTVPTLLPRSATAATTRARPRNLQMAAGLLAGPRLAVAALLLSAASAASVTVHGCVCQNAADCDSNRPYRRGLRWCETTEPCVQQDNEQYDWDFCEAHTDAQAGREMCDVFGERGFDTRCPENKPPAPPGFVASVVTTFAWGLEPCEVLCDPDGGLGLFGLIGKTFSALGYGLILLMAFGALRSIQAEAERKKAKGN